MHLGLWVDLKFLEQQQDQSTSEEAGGQTGNRTWPSSPAKENINVLLAEINVSDNLIVFLVEMPAT